MKAEILTVGDELLSGETVDTNSSFLDGFLAERGISVCRHSTVPDEVADIASAITEAASRASFVIVSGGLGPTEDDLTLEALAKALGCGLRRDEATIEAIKARFASFGREMTPNNERQAMVPELGEVIENAVGTAPSFTAPLGEAQVYLLPGVPSEVRWLMENRIGPRLPSSEARLLRRTIKVIGFGESKLEHSVREVVRAHRKHVRFGYRAMGAETHIKLAASGEDRELRIREAEEALRAALPGRVFGTDADELSVVLGELLAGASVSVATAESCTGGYISKILTDAAGSSRYFVGGCVCYANSAKIDLLGVQPEAIEAHGAVSELVARQMAEGAKRRFGADYGLSSTGIAGPTGGSKDKPVGRVYIAIAGPEQTVAHELQLPGDREMVRRSTSLIVLDLLRREVQKGEGA